MERTGKGVAACLSKPQENNMKIAFISDVRGWAFDVTYKGINKFLDADLYYTSDEPRINGDIIKQYDACHFFNWLGGQEFAGLPNVSAGVCQHNYEIKWADISKKYLTRYKKIVAISQILCDKLIQWNPNTHLIPNAVDETLFTPTVHDGEFTVGFVGQKTIGGFGEVKGGEGRMKWDIKGFELMLKPLLRRMKSVKFKVHSCDYTNATPYEEMPNIYRDMDVLICTSIFEGAPFPVLEAASCGKAVIATKVGITPELIKHGHNGFLVDTPRNRSEVPKAIDDFERYIDTLSRNRELCRKMGERNREEILKAWTWEKITPLWRKFFDTQKTL